MIIEALRTKIKNYEELYGTQCEQCNKLDKCTPVETIRGTFDFCSAECYLKFAERFWQESVGKNGKESTQQ